MILAILGILSGILSTMSGIGGGPFLLTIMTVVAGATSEQAAGTSSLIIILSKGLITLQNILSGRLSVKRLMILGVPALGTALLGVKTAKALPVSVIQGALSVLLIYNVYFSLKGKRVDSGQPEAQSSPLEIFKLVVVGSLAGYLAGFFGIGGGPVNMPLLQLAGLSFQLALDTSLGLVFISSMSSVFARIKDIQLLQGLFVAIGDIIGSQIGSYLKVRISERLSKRVYALICLVLAIYYAYIAIRFP